MTEDESVEKLLAVFFRMNADGTPTFSVEEITHFLPWALVNLPVDFAALDDALVQIFADTCAKAGCEANTPAVELKQKLDAYYTKNPANPQLVAALQETWREVNAEGAVGANPFAKFAGGDAQPQRVEARQRPQGTATGALARFALPNEKNQPKKPG